MLAVRVSPRVGCLILAAGSSSRFAPKTKRPGLSRPGSKLLALLNGTPVLQRAIDAACGSSALSCTLVLGDRAAAVSAAIDLRRCASALNRNWRKGLSSSIRAGLHGQDCGDACIIMLGDQPFVTSTDIDRLIEAWCGQARSKPGCARDVGAIAALRAGDVWGAPVLFPRRDFAALARLGGDAGAKRYAMRHMKRLVFVQAADVRAFEDVDTLADLRRLNERGTRRTHR
jgi:molybdenum cofactor cytidylyltransferase